MQLQISPGAFQLEGHAPECEPLSLYDLYMSTFETLVADTDALREACFRLRYQVYCVENEGYEPASAFVDGLERDSFDTHSAHALLRHRASGEFVGTVRTILDPGGAAARDFPVDRICAENRIGMPRSMASGGVAELSRFCIAKRLRRQVLDSVRSHPEDRARIMPAMSLGLMRGCYLLTRLNGATAWCMVMEQRLIEFLGKHGIHFRPIGPMIEFHGQRQVCHEDVDCLMARMKAERPDVWDIITDKGRYCALSMPRTIARKPAGSPRRLKASA